MKRAAFLSFSGGQRLMRCVLPLLFLTSAALGQTPDLKTILDANAASFKAIENLSYDYRVERQMPLEQPPVDEVVTGHFAELDPHHRALEESSNIGSTMPGKPGIVFNRVRRRSILTDHSAATCWLGESTPAVIYDFEDPNAIPQNAYDACLAGLDNWYHAPAFGSRDGPLSALYVTPDPKTSISTEIRPLPDGAIELRRRFGKNARLVSVDIINPQRGFTLRERRSLGDDGKTIVGRCVSNVEALPDAAGVWFPTSVEAWSYQSHKSAPALQLHTKTTFTHVSIGSVKTSDCELTALHLPDAWVVLRYGVDGKSSPFFTQENELVNEKTAHKSGLEQRAFARTCQPHASAAK